MLLVWLLMALAVPCQYTYAAVCTYTCAKKESTKSRCGWFQECTRYRTVYGLCARECVNGGWSDYVLSNTSACSVSCGGGAKSLTYARTCTDPAPANGGMNCTGENTKTEIENCNEFLCLINGGWSDYVLSDTSACSVSCGGGTRSLTYTRTCTDPAPVNGGMDCTGVNTKTETENCNELLCPINGGWSGFSEWKNYDECDVLCGGGYADQWRSRTCTNPSPAFGGDECVGSSVENRTITCNNKICGEKCPSNNPVRFIAHQTNNQRFYQCDNEVARLHRCPPGTVWHHEILVCDHEKTQGTGQFPQAAPTINCAGKSFVVDPTDCTKFYQCTLGGVAVGPQQCPSGLAFRTDITACDFRRNVPGC